MFHPLALIEIEDGRPEHFLKPFFQIAFIDGHLPGQLPDGKRFAYMLEQDLPRLNDLFPVGLIGQELTLKAFHLFFPNHTLQAVQE